MNNPCTIETSKMKSLDGVGLFFTIVVVFFPVLSMYRFGKTMLSLGDVIALFLLLTLIIASFSRFRLSRLYLVVFALVLSHSVFLIAFGQSLSGDEVFDLMGTTMRLLLVWLLLSLSKQFFIIDIGKKVLVVFATVSTVYLFLQYLLASMGIYVGGGIPFLSSFLYKSVISDYAKEIVKYNQVYRARSFFEEPIHYSLHVVLAIIVLLFESKKKTVRNWLLIAFLSLGVVLSMSLLGWIALVFSFAFWLRSNLNQGLKLRDLFVIIASIVGAGILWNTSYVQNVVSSKFLGGSGFFADQHFEGYSETLSDGNIMHLMFGNGLIETPQYLAGIPRMLYSFGIVGVFISVALFFRFCVRTSNNRSRCIMLLFAILNIGSELLFGKFILLFFSFCTFDSLKESNAHESS